MGVEVGGGVGDSVGNDVGVGGIAGAPHPTSNVARTISRNKRINLAFFILPPQVKKLFLDGASH
jgi:hypothetical protein